MTTATATFAAQSATSALAPFTVQRRAPGPRDVQIEILYCGVCHSDLHTARNEWKGTMYPSVPGHEIVGKVSKVGNAVTSFKVGDLAAVGCMVNSCRDCTNCKHGLEQFCENDATFTYNSKDPILGGATYGGYSKRIVVDESFAFAIPASLAGNLAGVAPLLCAGITTYSPLVAAKVHKGSKVGVVGLGGLGHMAIKIAAAMGAEVTVFTTSANKVEDAKRLGAHEVVISKDEEQMKKRKNKFDLIIDTVSAKHDINAFLGLLGLDGNLTLVGAPEDALPVMSSALYKRRRSLSGSLIGGLPETQAMLEFCAQHQLYSDVEVIPIQQINEAYERLLRSDVKYRFVIDMSSLQE